MKFSALTRHILVFGVLLVGLTACDSLDSRLQDINTDPTKETSLKPGFQLTNVQLLTSGGRYETWRNNLIYNSTMVQHFASLTSYWAGDKYFYISSYSAAVWDRWYDSAVKEAVDLERRTRGKKEMVNKNAVAKIMKVFIFHRLTDLYGDIPYSEAGLAFYEGISKPKYDKQKNIYDSMLKELETAVGQFDQSKPMYGNGDIMFDGSIAKWKKFGNSLMLRLALRMVKVNNSKAQKWAQKAINGDGGLMESNDDIAYIPHQSGPSGINKNGNGEVFAFIGPAPPYMSDTFVSWMKSKDDPRLRVYGEDDGDPAKGLPNGFDAGSGSSGIQSHSSWVSCEGDNPPDPCGTDVYMKPNKVLLGVDDPMFFQTYAEVELMRAEAKVRWGIGSGSAESHYRKGVRAALNYLSMYGEAAAISQDKVDTYVSNVPWASNTQDQIRQINEQYWAATLMNEYEAYANWRRTGYPELTPTDYPGNRTDGRIPRRMIYPNSEASVNKANYNEAVSRYENGDSFMSRMWWDVKK
ncbi:MAG: SusD/RagB family nutrient-binding outer membrane lipoprotein [Salinibacter sp.]|uniref:SusD/RagB family nutrient-binding outer membrane lipoprotein n=1 Tax=Salinibacter sp. TaxID=2065818 RepID=UPI0035D52814